MILLWSGALSFIEDFERGDSDISDFEDSMSGLKVFGLIGRILYVGYWILIIVLAVNLHKAKKISITELIFIIIFAPLAILFYFISLRKKFKQFESENSGVQNSTHLAQQAPAK